MKLLNALSLNMVNEHQGSIFFREITLDDARGFLSSGFDSAIGHADTAAMIAGQLGMTVPARRTNVALKKGDRAVVVQYKGPRLPVGATALPIGSNIVWYVIEVM